MRNWRDQAPPSGGRPSRPNPNDQRPISRPVDPSRSRSSGANGGSPNQSYPRRNDPNQSYPRRNDANQSYPRRDGYDEYDQDDRALMVTPNMGGLMPQLDDRALPALPSEEEERSLGIRRPAFIPATDERKGAKPGRWRVVSGILSIMLLCMAACGASSFLVRQNVIPQLNILLGFTTPKNLKQPISVLPTQFANGVPLITPVPSAKTPIQSDIKSYNFIVNSPTGGTVIPKNPTSVFKLGQVIYVVMNLNSNVKAGDKVSAQWFFNNIDVTPDLLRSNSGCCSKPIKDTGKELQVYFSLKPTTTGSGSVQIAYNGKVAYTILFYEEVSDQPTATPVPTKPTAVPAKPTPAPTKHP